MSSAETIELIASGNYDPNDLKIFVFMSNLINYESIEQYERHKDLLNTEIEIFNQQLMKTDDPTIISECKIKSKLNECDIATMNELISEMIRCERFIMNNSLSINERIAYINECINAYKRLNYIITRDEQLYTFLNLFENNI